MEQFIEDYKELADERDYLQDVVYPNIVKELDESLDEVIAVKKEWNELREKLKKQQEGDLAYTDILVELVARTKAQSNIKNIEEDFKKE